MSRTSIFALFLIIFSFVLVSNSALAGDNEWRPVTPEEIAQKTPKVEADADAEAIFWEIRLDDKKSGRLSYNHYVRVKIFTERGREKFSKFDIPFSKDRKIEDVAARVIKPDGSIVQLNPSDIFEREIIRSGKFKVQAKSFAIPSIDIGVIVEYQYKETFKGDSLDNERLPLQRDIPIQRLTYYIRPYEKNTVNFKFYNTEGFGFSEDEDKFYRGTSYNIPAFKEEPQMPPDDEVRPWLLLRYGSMFYGFNWNLFGVGAGEYFREAIKPSKEIKQKASELTAGLASDEEKLKRLYDFTQKQIRNITFDRSYTDEQRENIKIKNPNDALKTGVGNSQYVDLLFASLAKAAGFEPNLFMASNRSENFFQPDKYLIYSFLHPCCIGINVGGNWKFFNPGSPFLPYGNVVWYEETTGLLVSEANSIWKTIPYSTPTTSLAKRSGKFKLLEDGTLEGNANVEYYGQRAIVRRQEHYFDSPSKREDEIKEDLKQRINTAEVSEVMVENFDDNSKPLIYSYKIRIPNYAQKTGKRLFFQPSFFEYGEKPMFTSSARLHPIYFEYGWENQDEINFDLPSTFTLESAEVPEVVADNKKIISQAIKISPNDDKTSLKYNRDFHVGANGNLIFQAKVYQGIKSLFDSFQKADTQTITLRQK